MNKVGGDNEHVVNAVFLGKLGLGSEHGIIGCIAHDGVGPVVCFLDGYFRVRAEGNGVNLAGAVKVNGFLVRISDESTGASSDHADF